MYSNNLLDSICYQLGSSIFFTQGAGGNVSVKEDNKLIIKASGKWLSDVYDENIYTEVDLNKITSNVLKRNFNFKINTLKKNQLKPSIETVVHGTIPKKYIIHIHHINSIVHLINKNCKTILESKLTTYNYNYSIIDYAKPGKKLAELINNQILKDVNTEVFLLKNHGVFFCSDNLNTIVNQINELDQLLNIEPISKINVRKPINTNNNLLKVFENKFSFFPSDSVQSLVHLSNSFEILKDYWNLYPDHIVFMKQSASIYVDIEKFLENKKNDDNLIFILKVGVFIRNKPSLAMIMQLEAYSEIIKRISNFQDLSVLTKSQVTEIVNWDSEKYRIKISK